MLSNFTNRSGNFYTFTAIATASTKAACVLDRPVKRIRLLNDALVLVDAEGHALATSDGEIVFEFPSLYGYPQIVYLATGAEGTNEVPYIEVLEYGDHTNASYFDCFDPIDFDMRAKLGSATVLGKKVSDLQSNVAFDNIFGTVTGELEYVTEYTGYSEDEDEQEGNFVVIAIDTSETGVTYKAKLGTEGTEKTFSANKDVVLRVTVPNQKLIITATKDSRPTVIKVYEATFELNEPEVNA